MAAQQERPPEKNIAYEFKATRALEVAHERAHANGRKLVNFEHLVDGINSQIPPEEKSEIYSTYEIDEIDLKLNTLQTITSEYLDFALLEEARAYTEPQFSPRVQRAMQYAEEIAALKQNQTLDVYDLFRGAVKVTEDEYATQKASFLNRTL